MLTAFVTHPDCLRHDMGADHPEAPARLDAINDFLTVKGLADWMAFHEAPLATDEQILRVHDALHLRELEAAAPAEGYHRVDPDTLMNRHTLLAARRAAGAVVKAVDLVLGGTAPSAFCCVRPPGHHAERGRAMGFCFFNNVAVGIAHALASGAVQRVALADFDVHHGNGSEDIFAGDARVLMVSTFQHPLYPFEGEIPKAQNVVSVPLAARTGGMAMREAVEREWLPALEAHRPQIVFVSAGFDAHREDDMANLGWNEADYEWITRRLAEVAARHARGRIVSVLEGGYALSALARSVAAHVRVLAGVD